jgi:hypothetical protein
MTASLVPRLLEVGVPRASREVADMTTPHYVIRGGMEGRERLRVLARVMWPTTDALFTRVG